MDHLKTVDFGYLKSIGRPADIASKDASVGLDAEQVFRRKFERREFIHAMRVATAADVLGKLPGTDEVIHVLMSGRYDGWDHVAAVLQLAAPAKIEELFIATLGFSHQNAGELLAMLDRGDIGRVWFNCSCYMRDASAELYAPLADALTKRGMKIKATRNHAKILAFALSDGRKIVVDGSMNLRSCKNVEQVNITESKELFTFYADYIRKNCEQSGEVK